MKKITLATIKSFIRKNEGKLFIRCRSYFDGMTDGTSYHKNPQFIPVQKAEYYDKYNFGISGAWFVYSSNNFYSAIDEGDFVGYSIGNCCKDFDLAIKKN